MHGTNGTIEAITHLGMAVQVETIKPKLKLPGTRRLKLKCDEPLSSFAFNLNLHRYSWDRRGARPTRWPSPVPSVAGAYTRSYFSST